MLFSEMIKPKKALKQVRVAKSDYNYKPNHFLTYRSLITFEAKRP